MPLRYLIWDEAGKIVKEGDDRSTLATFPSQNNHFLWLDIENHDKEEIEWLGKVFNFHCLALEDCITLNQRSKLEEEEDRVQMQAESVRHSALYGLTLRSMMGFLGSQFI